MYKDPDKQREANRKAQAKFKAKGITEGITNQGITEKVLPERTAAGNLTKEGIRQYRQAREPERTAQGNIRVSKPGDDDYKPQCETTRAFIEGRPKRPETGKRGLDIKCFEDLPADVQETIHKLSTIDGRIDPTSKAKRTTAAIKYQHLFPDRYEPMSVFKRKL